LAIAELLAAIPGAGAGSRGGGAGINGRRRNRDMNTKVAKIVTSELRKQGLTVERLKSEVYHERTTQAKTRAIKSIRDKTGTYCSLNDLSGYLNLSPSTISRITQPKKQ
jgi:transcriptional antiterminator